MALMLFLAAFLAGCSSWSIGFWLGTKIGCYGGPGYAYAPPFDDSQDHGYFVLTLRGPFGIQQNEGVEWSISDPTLGEIRPSGSFAEFQAAKSGEGTLIATYQGHIYTTPIVIFPIIELLQPYGGDGQGYDFDGDAIRDVTLHEISEPYATSEMAFPYGADKYEELPLELWNAFGMALASESIAVPPPTPKTFSDFDFTSIPRLIVFNCSTGARYVALIFRDRTSFAYRRLP